MSAAELVMAESRDQDEEDAIRLPVRRPVVLAIEQAIRPAPPPEKPCTLLHALSALTLCAEMNGTRAAMLKAGYQLLPRVKPKYQFVIADIMCSPDPVQHMQVFLRTLPDHILKMDTAVPD